MDCCDDLTSSLFSCLAGNLIVFGCDSIGDFCDSTTKAVSRTLISKHSFIDMPLSESVVGVGDWSSVRTTSPLAFAKICSISSLFSSVLCGSSVRVEFSSVLHSLFTFSGKTGVLFELLLQCCGFGVMEFANGTSGVIQSSLVFDLAVKTVGTAVSTLKTLEGVLLITVASAGGAGTGTLLAKFPTFGAMFATFADPFILEGRVLTLTIGTTVAFNLTQLKLLIVVIFCTGCITFKQGVRFIMGMEILSFAIAANCWTKIGASAGFGALVWRYV